MEGNAEADNGKFDYSKSADADFEKAKNMSMYPVGLGKEDDFKDLDLTGKLALIQRGEIPFSEKITNALHHGAVGALVYNNGKDQTLECQLMGMLRKFHLSLFQNAMGKLLKAGSYKVVFNNTMANRPSPEAE